MALSKVMTAASAALVLCGLAACDNGPSAVQTRERAEVSERDYAAPEDRSERATRASARRERSEEAPRYKGEPLWSASKRYGAEENARRNFERNGAAVGARDYDDFLAKVHGFVRKPPKGALTLTRANGDRLLYDPKSNLFAVVTRDGAPRTMFKPDDGMAYWEQQVAREARRTSPDQETQDG
ncbi:hypothetical protein [Caulobacter sp. 17J80-11]|uniref:hypothetical protein n=1 Tax=Caulobacter sp. 17J80-11 TaxID=2763502 RepID=UPI0016535FC2|nr:hypothetical protein [Caulobacter sp. 17J80-11]MBC6982825.1 hypothetical protein [Caulobacter sp. 17J80-11]